MIDLRWGLNFIIRPEVFVPLIFPGLAVGGLTLLGIIWLERKAVGKIQLRYGPLLVTPRLGGILQLLADGIKFFFSEPIIPRNVDKLSFIFAPILIFAFSILPVIGIPLSESYIAIASSMSLLVVLALLVITPIFFWVMGWASNNKFSFLGGVREGYLTVSYEIPFILSVIAMAGLYNSVDLIEIVNSQVGGWGGLINPIAALTFFLTTMISTGKFPYEIGEADSEIIGGVGTEYSGILYMCVMGASYLRLYVMSLLFTVLFLGGWNPLPSFVPSSGFLPGILIFIKSFIVMGVMVLFRGVYPRLRIDQAVRISWQKLFVLSMASVAFSVGLVMMGFGGIVS
ncbi:NADH dehydrogenase [candidate division MSBL1 archaeon SCGC-AAA259M10]|uniref:NADH dehydrogenase n=1 Tax=candidate division MSBL1 archaeon SCGC-AAA259M10 TaxID=1698270 RepID=A0A133V041_9EURY|nr:NADH dehydrogenase [candidate division MSBL1 archaeon SCGC-AAA259M10]